MSEAAPGPHPDPSGPVSEHGADPAAGDVPRAHRSHRTSRLIVTAILCATASLWFADQYLRLPRLETMFRMTKTLPAPSARAVLRNLARQDATRNTSPNPRYLEALGDVEEPDLAPSVYDQAFRLDSRNALLAVKSGCALFHAGRFFESRDRCREAAALSPPNRFPRYLEAAALCASLSEKDDVGDTLAILARANASEAPIILPEPLWHPTLPETGAWQVRVKRDMDRWLLAPLYAMTDVLRERARKAVMTGREGAWREWSGVLETAGVNLIRVGRDEKAVPGLEQIQAGIEFIRAAQEIRNMSPPSQNQAQAMDPAARAIEDALEKIADFQNSWEIRIKDAEQALKQPIKSIIVTGVLVYGLLYFLSGILGRMFGKLWRLAKNADPSRADSIPPLTAAALWAALLSFALFAYPLTSADADAFRIWWNIATAFPPVMAALIAIYQSARPGLPAITEAKIGLGGRISYGLGRFRIHMGAVNKTALVLVCLWLIAFRVIWNAYPFQFSLITPGLTQEEMELARQARMLILSAIGSV